MTSIFTLTVFLYRNILPEIPNFSDFFLTGTIEYNNLLSPEYNQAFCFGQTGEFKKYDVILPDGFSLTKGQRSKRDYTIRIGRTDTNLYYISIR